MKNIFLYLNYIDHVHIARVSKDLSLPVFNQAVQMSGSLCFFLLHLFSFSFIIRKFNFQGWSQPELWILLFTFEIFTYSAFFLFWRGFIYTVRDISTGAFDLVLSKPITSRLTSFFRGGGSHNLFSASAGAILLAITIIVYRLPINPIGLLLYLVLLISSLWITYCIGVAFISLNLRYGRLDSTIGVVFQVQEAYKFPSTAYSKFNVVIWAFLSALSLLTTLPTAALLSKPLDVKLIILYVVTLILTTCIAHYSWSSGLRHYSSASS